MPVWEVGLDAVLYERALAMVQKSVPAFHPFLAKTFADLAEIQFLRQRVQESLASIQRAAAIVIRRGTSVWRARSRSNGVRNVHRRYMRLAAPRCSHCLGVEVLRTVIRECLPSAFP